jgi:predicted HicB family RNase H-like nuclease
MERKGRKRLWAYIPEQLHAKLQHNAKKKNMSLTKYITRALLRYMLDQEKYENQ